MYLKIAYVNSSYNFNQYSTDWNQGEILQIATEECLLDTLITNYDIVFMFKIDTSTIKMDKYCNKYFVL